MKIVFATGNGGKLREASEILGRGFELVTPVQMGVSEDIPETGTTLRTNSLQKADYLWNKCGCNCFADDTGLEVDVLGGAPGVHTARYAGDDKDFNRNMDKLLDELSRKETEIEKIEYNLATASSPKIQNICEKQLEKLEAEKSQIEAELEEKSREILNLDNYITFGLALKDNMLKLWQLSNLSQKRHIQNLVFPDGLEWNKEKDDIEPLSKNEFLFVYGLKSDDYKEKKHGQTLNSEDLSAFAPEPGLEPGTL